ncbi:MAG: fibronectin type III domain-containing protein [Caldilineaceae bacterium]|nr:fibronectin type III domain-containing protein [Caldilineaceae bacterium]
MYFQSIIPLPLLRLGFAEKLLALLAVASLLLQPLAGIVRPTVAPQPLPSTGSFVQPLTSVAPVAPDSSLAPPYALPPELEGTPEVPALRTADTATFDLGDGRYALVQDVAPLHYLDKDGAWQRINPAYQQVAGRWVNATNTVRTALDPSTSAATLSAAGVNLRWQPQTLEIVDAAGHSRTLSTPHSNPQPGVPSEDSSTVRYHDGWTPAGPIPFVPRGMAIHDQWQSGPGQVEYTLRLPGLPTVYPWQSTPATLDVRVQLQLQPGATLLVEGEPVAPNSSYTTRDLLVFRDASGEELMLQPPSTYEQAHRAQAVAGDYQVTTGADPAQVELRVRTPWSWLAAPERQFPVIIDPLFQMRRPFLIAEATYDPATGYAFKDLRYVNNRLWVGRNRNFATRAVLRFDLPLMPPGAQLDRAWLYAVPSGYHRLRLEKIGGLYGEIAAYDLQNENWINGGEPAVNLNTPIEPGTQLTAYSAGQKRHPGVKWDVTTQAKSWLPIYGSPFVSNPGILLRLKNEFCDPASPLLLPETLLCGSLEYDMALDAWDLHPDLENTQVNGAEDDPQLLPSATGGIRLVVFYHSETTLLESTPSGGNVLSYGIPGNKLPQQADLNPPYYYAEHRYRVDVPPDRWQAVAARSFRQPIGKNPPTQIGEIYQVPLTGTMQLDLRSSNDSFSVSQGMSGEGQVSYLLLNGRGESSPLFQQKLPLRTTYSPAANAQPGRTTGYDIRLVGEAESIVAPLNVKQTVNYQFDSADPMALWDLQLPPGSNAAIRIGVVGDGTRPKNLVTQFANRFVARVVRVNSMGDVRNSSLGDKTVGVPTALNPNLFTSLDVDNVQAGNHALVIQYNGPDLTTYNEEECGKEFCDFTVVPVKYSLEVEVLACPAGAFPTNTGRCQAVVCPSTTSLAAYYRETNDYGLWNNSDWSSANETNPVSSVVGDTAPMIGPRKVGAQFRPLTVVAVGGKITYNKTNGNIMVVSENGNEAMPAKVRLVECPMPGATTVPFLKSFNVFEGRMSHPHATLEAGLRPAPLGSGQIKFDPWPIADRQAGDLEVEQFVVAPNTVSTATGSARVRRTVGQQQLVTVRFNASWSVNAGGWPSLTSTIAEAANQPALPTFASLLLDLGNQLELDTTPADGDSGRIFIAIRARTAVVAQPPKLGGASKPVQLVILPRGIPMPALGVLCPANCLDLRGPNDVANGQLDRAWSMPDVHTNVDAKTVLMNAAGVMEVYSSDHPNMVNGTNQAFAKEFSFDAYKATVTVDFTQCGGAGPDVWVIRGETTMTLPNIGNTGGSGGISAGFMLCETSLRSVKFSFESPFGVPIGNSGLFLTGLRGAVDIFPDYTQIKVGLNFQAAPGGDGGIFKAYGEVTIDTRGLFEFGGGGTVLGVVDADGRLWVAWSPLDTGFEINVRLGRWFRGFARAHMWQGQGWQNRYSWLPDNNEMHFAGEIGATITIEESAVMWLVPPADISIGIEVAFGEFCTNKSCTRYEWGIKGKIVIVGFDVGIYYGFDKGLDFILGNDNHLLIDEYGGGLVMAAATGALNVGVAPAKVSGVATIPFTVSPSAEQILVAASWQAGSPILTLIDPDGVELSVDTVAAHNGQTDGSPNIRLFGLQQPKQGVWQARLSNLSEEGVEHYRFLYFANKGAPGTPGNHGRFLTPAAVGEPGANSYNITWEVPADVTEPATISLFYERTLSNGEALSQTGTITGNLLMGAPIVQNLPFSAGSFQWNTSGLLNGDYRIRAVVDDGVNELPEGEISIPDNLCLPQPNGLPTARAFDPNRFPGTVVFTSTGTIRVNDVTPPATPIGLRAAPSDSALLVEWDATPDPDVAAYLVRWGIRRPDALPQGFLVQNEKLIAAPNGERPQLYLIAVDNGKQYGVDVAALDINGNASAPTAAVFAVPDGTSNPVPLQPGNLAVTGVSSTSASFGWQLNPDGPTPAGYRLTYVELTQFAPAGQVEVAGPAATLADLKTGVTYDIQVAALNSDGWSSLPTERVRVVVSNGVDGDGDGLPDDWATAHGVSSANEDADGDGLTNGAEYALGSNPNDQDSDNDGASDGEEQLAGADPLSASEFAGAYTQPRLSLERDTLRFTVKLQPGGDAAPQTVQWLNSGGGNLQLQASSAESWIQPAVVGDQVQVALNSSGLTPGFHSGVVRLSAALGSDPVIGAGPRGESCIRVNAWVQPADDDVPPAPKQDQTISFAPLSNQLLGTAPIVLTATASSGLPVSFASNTPTVCTVENGVVTLIAVGTCSITAVQAGDGTFNPAPSVTRNLVVFDGNDPLPLKVHLALVLQQ